MITETIAVPEVHCDHCVSSIEGAVGTLDGVEAVEVDLEATAVTVTYDEGSVDRPALVATIEEQGYLVEG